MGEYATYKEQEIKIGTCEDLYYLRFDQRDRIRDYDFTPDVFRYRFPFPDEDGIEPGAFSDHDRGERIPGWTIPADWIGHYSVQFIAQAGYVASLPCPESVGGPPGLDPVDVGGVKVHRNGWHGHAVVKQQRLLNGQLLTVVGCNACGAAWRLETLEDAEPVIVALRAEADRERRLRGQEARADYLHTIADRIAQGYAVSVLA